MPLMYAKIFQQIYSSSIANDYLQRLVFMDMLVLADQNGVVDMTHEAIARFTNVPIEIVRPALVALEGPDPKSRNPKEAGARLVRLDDHRDWGWIIVNYEEYRLMASEEQRREKTRERVRRFKLKHNELTHGNASVTHGNAGNAKEKERKKDRNIVPSIRFVPPSLEECLLYGEKIGLPREESEKYYHKKTENGWRTTTGPMKSWQSGMNYWKINWESWRKPNGNGRPATSVYELKTVMETKQKMATELKNKYCFEGPVGNQWDNDMSREDYNRLKKEIKELEKRIGGAA